MAFTHETFDVLVNFKADPNTRHCGGFSPKSLARYSQTVILRTPALATLDLTPESLRDNNNGPQAR